MEEIRGKSSSLTVQDLKRLLFRCAATLISLEKVSYHTGSSLCDVTTNFESVTMSSFITSWLCPPAYLPHLLLRQVSKRGHG
jgi:hypothetical protein